jgi:hypothetical protein
MIIVQKDFQLMTQLFVTILTGLAGVSMAVLNTIPIEVREKEKCENPFARHNPS